MIEPAIELEIRQRLVDLEQAEDARIVFAVESGSRAWGFPSRDSDYDARFIYVRRPEWYLSVNLEDQRDVIEQPLAGEFDLSGWDIRKAMKLFIKSNPPLLEWLDSSIVYLDRYQFARRMRELRQQFFSAPACAYHYLHMAQGNFRASLQGTRVREKKYFYVLRPILAVRWIEQGRGVVPMLFCELLQTIQDQPLLLVEIDALLKRKMAGEERDEAPVIQPIHDFVASELSRMETLQITPRAPRPPYEALDELFRSLLAEIWGDRFRTITR